MSSSVFIETSLPASGESLLNGDVSATNADSNLVVVYGKNGMNVDRKGLENLIDEKTLTSISVIRITSPTPSMQEDEAEEMRKEENLNAEENEKSDASEDEEDEAENSDSDDEPRGPKPTKATAKPRPEILGLTVEEFYPPEVAKKLAKEILKYAGVTPLKCNVDYEFQRYVIKNDHCYTPYTSPSQLTKVKSSFEEEDKQPVSTVLRKLPGTVSTVKQYLNKRKLLIDEKQRKLKEKEKSSTSVVESDGFATDEERREEDQDEDGGEDAEEEESDYTEESEESAESDNDRDSDLDFDVNNRHGRKRKTAIGRRRKKEKQRARSVMMQKAAHSKRRQQSQDTHEEEKAVLTPVKVIRQPVEVRKPGTILNSIKGVGRKQIPESVEVAVAGASLSPLSPPPPPPPAPQQQHTQPKPLINIQSVQVIHPATNTPTQPKAVEPILPPPKPVQPPSPAISKSPQTVKQIAINKVIASPKGGFTDLSTLLARSDSMQTNVKVTEKTASPSTKGFMPLGIETAAKNQLPAQISIQTHQSSSEIAAENDKQLDLIDSIVKDELEKPFKSSVKPPMKENSIPDLVKMLESTEKAVLEKTKLTSSFTPSSVEAIDIANAPLLETPDDEIPDDLFQHVVELMQDKSLQEAVEKEVLQQQQQQQQQQEQQESLQQQQQKQAQQKPPLHLPQSQNQGPIPSQPLRHSSIITTPTMKQPRSIIEASISNTSTPSSSRDTTPTPANSKPHSVAYMRKEPIQIVRGNGRVITLPPIEAPTTRAKRRAQAQPTDSSFNDSESCDVSMHSDTSMLSEMNPTEKAIDPVTPVPAQKERATSGKATTVGKKKSAAKVAKQAMVPVKTGDEEESQEDEDEDDPNKLWCICRQPHNNRFMICCDVCEDWFHGTCVSITKAMGLEMEQKGIEWTCPKCVKKQETKKQRKITDLFDKFDKKTLVQPMPRLDDFPKLLPNNVTTASDLDRKQVVDVKKTDITQFLSSAKVDTPKKVQQRMESSFPAASVSVASPAPITPDTVQRRSTELLTKKTPEGVTAVPNSTKRVIVLPATPKLTGRGIAMVKATQAAQQQLKLTKVPTAAEKKQFTAAAKVQQQSKTPTQAGSFGETELSPMNSNQPQKRPVQKPNSLEMLTCIVCKKAARANSIYCSDDCIRKHAQNALINVSKNAVKSPEPAATPSTVKLGPDEKKKKTKGLFEDLLSLADRKPKVERVYVFERRTGKYLTGNNAPTTANLKKWLQDNPTFEVVQPGSPQAMEIEKSKLKGRMGVQSPTNSNSFTPVKVDGAVVTSVITLTPPAMSSPPPVFPKLNKVQDFNKSGTKTTTSLPVHLCSTPKLHKHPQQGGLKADRADKEKEKPAPSSSNKTLKKQVSVEKEVPAAQNTSRNESSEPVRVNVRRTLKEQLLVRMSEISEDKRLTAEQVEDFVKATELEMYRLFNKDIGTKYKAKYRSLMFNIKDRKNETLFQKICCKLIEPRQLVRMSPEEMASQELAQWRENEAKHQLEMIKKSELDMLSCAKNYVLKTHKGEEVIEGKATDRVELDISIPVEDVVTVLNNATVSSTTEIEASSLTPRKDHAGELDGSLNVGQDPGSVTASSTSDKKKASSREREREREKRHKSKDRHREKARKRSRSRSRERRHKSSSRKDERRDKEERLSKKEEHEPSAKVAKLVAPLKITLPPSAVAELKASTPPKVHKDRDSVAKKSVKAPIEKFNLIDQILESTKTVEQAANLLNEKEPSGAPANATAPANTANTPISAAAPKSKPQSPSAADSDQEPSSTVSISTPPDDPYYKYFSDSAASMWTGSINMIDVASFQVSIQAISGNTYLLSKDLPEELDVVGRISPDTVWDYIGKIKRSPNKEIVIIRLVPSAESENIAYTILYKYLDKRKRLGVIKTTSPNIKDFYIMPLGVGQQMPAVLDPNENFEFYEDVMRPDMLLGIVIRIMGKRHSNAAMRMQRKKEATVISNRLPTSGLDGDEGAATFTPPGSPKLRTDAIRSGTGSSRGLRGPQKSTDVDEIDIDAIIKAPITSKNASKGQPSIPTKRDDADEPYSPGGSSDDEVQLVPLGVRDDDFKRKMDEINRQIEAQKMEIAGLLKHEQSSLAPSLANISIPSNLHQILASIQSKPDLPALPSVSAPSMVPPPPLIGSLSGPGGGGSSVDEEYTPEQPIMCPSRGPHARPDSKPSRLAQLSEAELLSMVPDDIDIDLDSSTNSSNKNAGPEPPPEKRPRWSEPPPPGLEGEYN